MNLLRSRTLGWMLVSLTALLIGRVLLAQTPPMPAHDSMSAHVTFTPDQIKWAAGPPGLPAGAQMAVLDGDPGKEGVYTLRVKFPAGFKIPPHWHPTAEHVTVLSGAFNVGSGDTLDKTKTTRLPPGGFTALPASMHHFALCEEDTIVQVHGMGPFTITYVNPADDPRRMNQRGTP